MNVGELTDRQRNEQEHFDKNLRELRKIDFNHYSKPEYGPWNPYWFIYNLVRESYQAPTQRLLSFGCGRGQDALRYAHIGYEVHGFDISPASIQNAEKLAKQYGLVERAHFSVQPAETLTYADDSFDLVVGENVLHHVNIDQALKEVLRVLKRGGFAVFKEPVATPMRDRIRRSPPISWLVPVGVKNLHTNARYDHPEDTVKLTEAHFDAMRRLFSDVQIVHFRLLAVLNVFARKRTFLERCDLRLFTLFPPLRRFGDMVVIILRKQ